MIIVLRPDSTDGADRPHPRAHPELGFKPHLSRGELRTIIGVIGDENKLQAEPLPAIPGVEQVLPILKPFKLASREFHADDTVVEVGADGGRRQAGAHRRRLAGDDRRPVRRRERRGPGRPSPAHVKAAGANILRGGAFKPRTSPYSFQGLGEEGLQILRDVGHKHGMPVVTEVMDPRQVRAGRALRRHVPDRRPQHAELRPAQGGRPDAASRCCSSAA